MVSLARLRRRLVPKLDQAESGDAHLLVVAASRPYQLCDFAIRSSSAATAGLLVRLSATAIVRL
jgi:hypothetical protein